MKDDEYWEHRKLWEKNLDEMDKMHEEWKEKHPAVGSLEKHERWLEESQRTLDRLGKYRRANDTPEKRRDIMKTLVEYPRTGDEPKPSIPFPDPLGILESITGGMIVDPILSAREIKEESEGDDQIDQQVNEYISHLEGAYKVAPCPGCIRLVESALVAAEVYKRMEEMGATADEIKDAEIDNIRETVKQRIESL